MSKKGKQGAGDFFDVDPFEAEEVSRNSALSREQIDLFGGEEANGEEDTWRQFKEKRRQDNVVGGRPKNNKTEDACIRVFFFIPKLPKSSCFKRWLPEHRHILFGHFAYWIIACMVSAASGTSLSTKCSDTEAVAMFVILILISLFTGLPKLFSADGFVRGFGPTMVSFLMMFSTALSLHQKPLICGFPNNSRRVSRQARANQWAVILSLQVMTLLVTMLFYMFWHLKQKDEKREEQLAGEESEKSSSDEDSMQSSPASVRWTATHQSDQEV